MALKHPFQDVYPKQIQDNIVQEFVRLKDLCYLDHTGSTLYALSQIRAVTQDLCENVYGNPHSLSTSSRYTSDVVDQIRYRVLKHFNTDPNEYGIIFTNGATGALKLVSESFDWTGEKTLARNDEHDEHNKYDGTPGTFSYLQDNHTSVLGMREEVAKSGADVQCISHDEAFEKLSPRTHQQTKSSYDGFYKGNSLFVYPAQCNFSGVKYPLTWISAVQNGKLDQPTENSKIFRQSKWFCLLDAATFVATNPLDLSLYRPDFVCLSFYKIFGYPTGLGALLVKNTSAHTLNKAYFGGGTVLISLSSEFFHIPRPVLHDKFEDGTIPFLSIISLQHGFNALHRLTPGMSSIARHTFSLARYVHHHLVTLHHANGKPVAVIYADTNYESVETQGNVVNFNLLRPDGEHIGFMEVLNMANLHNIHLRTGCFCNPGACQRHLKLSNNDLRSHYQAGHVCGDEKDLIEGRPTGSVRISFGYMSNKSDADTFLSMVQSCFIEGEPLFRTPDYWDTFTEIYSHKFGIKMECNEEKHYFEEKINSLACTRLGNCIEADVCDLRTDDVSALKSSFEVSNANRTFLSHIFLYPVKSCGAFSVKSWLIGSRGLMFDREWMVVTPSGVCLSQKQDTRLCLITPTIDLVRQVLQLDFPGMSPMCIPLNNVKEHTDKPDSHSSLCQSKVCGDRIQGWDCGDDVALWLSEALMRDGLRLIRQWNSDQRTTKRKGKTEATDEKLTNLSLSNQAQFLLVNLSSVESLVERLSEGTNLNADNLVPRFRCNLVIQGAEPFSENSWRVVDIGQNHFQSEGPCTRCQMVCIDQATGEKTREPLKTLAEMFHGKMRFGLYLSHISAVEETEISVGDLLFPQMDCN